MMTAFLFAMGTNTGGADDGVFLRIRDWKTGEILAESPASRGGKLCFGWLHSLERIPWNEYYHIDDDLVLVLDSITFPAFGAGIPENKGRTTYIKDGLIHMEEIGQRFEELDWLNSNTATRDIELDGVIITSGAMMPHHKRLRLLVERGG
ncbi:MAG: DUF1850 domain-containing protein [Synergistaceae bacterium]|jgi:hypothetical protein|nr:DUF1850 domain-containing protein [Synergistaceae bacterium]